MPETDSTTSQRIRLNLIGQRFGTLIVIHEAERKGRVRRWFCHCDCGGSTTAQQTSLRSGETRSCGCLRKTANRKHGGKKEHRTTYTVWKLMRQRCSNPNVPCYQHYGGRGIHPCAAWNDFANFLADMGERPSANYSIDRINNDGGYWCGHCEECLANNHPSNCRWATRKEQGSNKRTTRIFEFKEQSLTLAEWGDRLGIALDTLDMRLRKGWSVEQTLTTPLLKRRERH